MGKYLEALEGREKKSVYTVKSVKNNILIHPRTGEKGDFFSDKHGFTHPQNPQNPPLSCGSDAKPQPLDENRNRLNRLESLLGSEGAAAAVVAAARHIEARNPDFWRRLKKESRHELAICAALLDAGELPE
jgi:hypothetical protein